MNEPYDLARPPRVAPREEPPIPAILMISVVRDGKECSLTLVRSHFRGEGHCLIQRLSDPRTVDLDEVGLWRITDHEGCAVLSIEADDPGIDTGDWDDMLDELGDAITDLPNCWADAYEARRF